MAFSLLSPSSIGYVVDAPGSLPAWNAFVRLTKVDCKTVGFFLKINKEIGKARRKSLTRELQTPVWDERKKTSLPSLALCFQPRSRPFVWLPRVLEFTLKYRLFCRLEKKRKTNACCAGYHTWAKIKGGIYEKTKTKTKKLTSKVFRLRESVTTLLVFLDVFLSRQI